MKTIEKKTWPDLFNDVLSDKKKFDLRVADFDIEVDDELVLREWDPAAKQYTGREIRKTVTYLLKTKDLSFNTQQEIDEHGFVVTQLD